MHTVGVVSDTHGLLRPEALVALRRVDHIIHAGDIGSPEILSTLAALAPLTVVRGNNDRAPWASAIPKVARVEIGGCRIYVLHDLNALDIDPEKEGIDVVVSGHSHKARLVNRAGVLYVNPGSIGPRRFKLPVAMAILKILDRDAQPQLMELEIEVGSIARSLRRR